MSFAFATAWRKQFPNEILGGAIEIGAVAASPVRKTTAASIFGLRMIARARNPKQFFGEFTRLVLEEDFQINHLETLDDSTHAVLEYLLGRG